MYKKKSKSLCAMCKDYKTNGAKRWTEREIDRLKRFAKMVQTGREV